MKAARGGSFEIYKCSESVFNCNIDYHKRSHSWYVQNFYQANQLEIKSNKNLTQAFYFELKVWPQLEIKETQIFSQTNSLWDNIGGICS